jgi:hypothetical protein
MTFKLKMDIYNTKSILITTLIYDQTIINKSLVKIIFDYSQLKPKLYHEQLLDKTNHIRHVLNSPDWYKWKNYNLIIRYVFYHWIIGYKS